MFLSLPLLSSLGNINPASPQFSRYYWSFPLISSLDCIYACLSSVLGLVIIPASPQFSCQYLFLPLHTPQSPVSIYPFPSHQSPFGIHPCLSSVSCHYLSLPLLSPPVSIYPCISSVSCQYSYPSTDIIFFWSHFSVSIPFFSPTNQFGFFSLSHLKYNFPATS